MLETYKTQVEEMDRDTREREEKLVEGAGFVKQAVLDETKESNEKLAAGEPYRPTCCLYSLRQALPASKRP